MKTPESAFAPAVPLSVTRIALAFAALAASPSVLLAHPNHAVSQVAAAAPRRDPQPPATTAPVRADARLSVTIRDAKLQQPTPARVRITDETGKPLGPLALTALPRNAPPAAEARLSLPGTVIGLPPQAIGIMYGPNDTAQGYAFQMDGAFYVNGSFDLAMPAGKFLITIAKGYEFVQQTEELTFKAGDHLIRAYDLGRWVDMPQRGWYSADDHIHLRRSPRENPLILDWVAAEDVHVGVLLQMGDFWTTYFAQYAWGEKGRYGAGEYVLTSGQEEPRTGELGHTISLGAQAFVRFQDDYFLYDKLFDRVHELGGVSGYAHQGMSFHGYRGMTLDVLAGKIDFLELMQFCVPEGPLAVEHYYRFLDLGYRLTALAGSDFPWCGRGARPGEEQVGAQIGNARFYTYVGDEFGFPRWLDGVKAGHTFVTSGPVIDLKVNGQIPGSAVDVKPGAKVRIVATANGHASQIPLRRLQVIGHGKILAEAKAGEPGQDASLLRLEFEHEVKHGIWLAARAEAGPSQMAHTTPVYVTAGGDGFHNRSNLTAQIDVSRKYLAEIRALLRAPTDTPRPSARSAPGPLAYREARARLEQRIAVAEAKLEELSRRR
ncbi:MAG: CehA/McbA family metallohydrolase [Opitutaceae bacterium]|nr:CehA/McbA family metallohydrolase [Opitutaceae bacterium]